MPESSHGETRCFRQLGASMITEISEVSKGWRHCASAPAEAPHSSISHTSAGLSRLSSLSGLFGLSRLFG
jgi:hypothetical protein